jgi:hypothetical protein
MKKQLSFILILALILQLTVFTGTIYADVTYSTVTCSAGSSAVSAGSASGAVVDDSITLSTGANLVGAKVYITTGFNAATDTLLFTDSGSISGSYNTSTGTLTLTGTATPADYQTALRTVRIKTSSAGTGPKTVVFALGTSMEHNGHYYEYVSTGAITWDVARTAASSGTFYGQHGYLATITSQTENDFLAQKIAADAWIGASDATTEGAWYWVTGPESGTLFYTGDYTSYTTYAGIFSNWASSQPDNWVGIAEGEDYGEMYCSTGTPGKWNDLPNSEPAVKGYLVEYSDVVGASSSKTVTVTPPRVVSYDGNGSTGGSVPGSSSYAHNTAATVSGNTGTLTQTGKNFAGWSTTNSGIAAYYPGDTFTITSNTTLYAIWADESTLDCSAGASSVTVGNTSGTVVDSGLTIGSGAMLTGAKANITTGFDSANDRLSFTATANISGSYDTAKGTLTLTGTASPAEYQTALRSVIFKTSASAVGTRTVVFSLGNKLAYGSHYYEYVSNGGSISWSTAKTAAEARTYYGQSGYLATITSQEENDFLAQKLAADAWIGASDATTEGAWYWVTGPAGEQVQFSSGNYPSMTSVGGMYNNWNSIEPNNSGSGEHYAEIYCSGGTLGKWNDLKVDDASVTGYLVEYNAAVGASDSKDVNIVSQSTDGGGRHSNQTPTSGVPVIVNGQVQSAGKQTESIQNGVKTALVDVDETVVSAKIDAVLAAKQDNQEEENIIEVPVSSDASDIKVALTGDIVKKMDDNDFTLNVTYDKVSYLIPAEEIKINDLAAQLGAGKLTDLEIKVEFRTPDDATLSKIKEQAQAKDYEIVIPPLNFEVIAVNTNTNQQTAVSRFSNYVERMFEIPSGVDPAKITTGIVYNADGTFSHIPTTIVKVGDKYFAKLNSLSNSTYSVIWNPVTFADMENHWAKTAADNLGSRLVVNGVGNGNFEPNRAITRGEFAAIITKALGIYRTGVGTDQFGDVQKTNIFYDAISVADDYGLITGYTNGLYEPDKKITREEAMAILTRAADIVKLENNSGKTVENFTDAAQVSDWAKDYVKVNIEKGIIVGSDGQIRPKADISRAEVATAVERILTETELIN